MNNDVRRVVEAALSNIDLVVTRSDAVEAVCSALSPLLAAKDERVRELEGLLHEAAVQLRDNCLRRNLLNRIAAVDAAEIL